MTEEAHIYWRIDSIIIIHQRSASGSFWVRNDTNLEEERNGSKLQKSIIDKIYCITYCRIPIIRFLVSFVLFFDSKT